MYDDHERDVAELERMLDDDAARIKQGPISLEDALASISGIYLFLYFLVTCYSICPLSNMCLRSRKGPVMAKTRMLDSMYNNLSSKNTKIVDIN